jgi:hypothetical protein
MKDLINPWVIAGSILTAALLLLVSFLVAGGITSTDEGSYSGDAAITIIPVPTYTPTPIPTRTVVPVVSPTPTLESGIQPEGFVQINGTEGEGLRMREDPSLGAQVAYVGLEGEIFSVIGGPVEADGYLWWHLEAPLNNTRQGWAVSNYLKPASGP